MQILRQALRAILLPLIAALLLFEEWGWEPLAALFARLARLPFWARIERGIAGLPPGWAVLVFGVPMLLLLPIKLLALYLFGIGQMTLGIVLLISAKIGGTALLARLFQLTQPALMQLRWFAWWYPRWKAWKDGVLAQVHGSGVWRVGLALKRWAKNWWADVRKP